VLTLARALGGLEGAFHGGIGKERLVSRRWNPCSGPGGGAL
jgi:hypothetical protein